MSLDASLSQTIKVSYQVFSNSPKAIQEKVLNFLNKETSLNELRIFQEEYPSIFKSCPGGESLCVIEQDRVVSHVAFIDREFQHPMVRMKLGLLGLVATHPDLRKRGFASQLVQQACLELKKKGCLIAVLWSDQEKFYLPLGFHRAGREQDLRFSTSMMRGDFGEVRPMDFDKDSHLIWRLYQKQNYRLDRSLEEQKKLLKTPQSKVFVTEKDGKLSSYIVVNKGADFTDYIHEWAGEPSELQRNISFCQKQYFPSQPLTLIAPSDADISLLKQVAEEKWEGALGLIKILDKNLLLSTYMNFLKINKIEHVWSKDKGTILFSDSEFTLDSELDVIQLVFGDEKRNLHPTLPLFLWGFDSI